MRISDWSSDVCSSDLDVAVGVVTNSLAANDVPAVHAGYASYRGQLLDGGVELYELRAQGAGEIHGLFGSSGASLHTKAFVIRSEEHTSELQSLMRISYAVFCLKKKKKYDNQNTNTPKLTYKKNM